MSFATTLEVRVTRAGDEIVLASPDAGLFTCSATAGSALAPGQSCGVLLRLGRAVELIVPAGVAGIVVNERPERVQAAVGYGSPLYKLRPFEDVAALASEGVQDAPDDALCIMSPQTGRFYHRPAPDDPPFARAGDVLEAGKAIGLIEVMKTFTQLPYKADGSLPQRARMVRYLVDDGADVASGDALIEVEPA